MRLLVVDDDPGICRMLGRILRVEGHVVLSAWTGAEALKMLESEEIDLVFLDYRLDDMDAPELLARMPGGPGSVPVIVMTGLKQDGDAMDVVDAGAARIVEKPFDINFIRRLVSEYAKRE